jgi:hypothetical protein
MMITGSAAAAKAAAALQGCSRQQQQRQRVVSASENMRQLFTRGLQQQTITST